MRERSGGDWTRQGFTLIEVLVALTLLTSVVVLAYMAQNLFFEKWQSIHEAGSRAVASYRRQTLLRYAAESIWEYYVTDPTSQLNQRYYPYFHGKTDEVRFVTLSSVFFKGHAAAARLWLRHAADSGELVYEEADLRTQYIRFDTDTPQYGRQWVISRDVRHVRIRYYGRDRIEWNPQSESFVIVKGWFDEYHGRDKMTTPEIIELRYEDRDGQQVLRLHVKSHNPFKEFFFNPQEGND